LLGFPVQPLDRDERRLVAGHIRLSDLEPRFVWTACG